MFMSAADTTLSPTNNLSVEVLTFVYVCTDGYWSDNTIPHQPVPTPKTVGPSHTILLSNILANISSKIIHAFLVTMSTELNFIITFEDADQLTLCNSNLFSYRHDLFISFPGNRVETLCLTVPGMTFFFPRFISVNRSGNSLFNSA